MLLIHNHLVEHKFKKLQYVQKLLYIGFHLNAKSILIKNGSMPPGSLFVFQRIVALRCVNSDTVPML